MVAWKNFESICIMCKNLSFHQTQSFYLIVPLEKCNKLLFEAFKNTCFVLLMCENFQKIFYIVNSLTKSDTFFHFVIFLYGKLVNLRKSCCEKNN